LNIKVGEEADMLGGLEKRELRCNELSEHDVGGEMLR
jgi:hypothetical protein